MSIAQLDILFQYTLMPATISYLIYINKILNRYYTSENIYSTGLKRNQRSCGDHPSPSPALHLCRPAIRALSVFQMLRLSIQRTFKKYVMKPRNRSLMRSPMHPKEQLPWSKRLVHPGKLDRRSRLPSESIHQSRISLAVTSYIRTLGTAVRLLA